MCMFSLRKSDQANLNPTTAWPLAMAMQGGQAPCRRMHPGGPLPESGRFVQTPRTPPAYGPASDTTTIEPSTGDTTTIEPSTGDTMTIEPSTGDTTTIEPSTFI